MGERQQAHFHLFTVPAAGDPGGEGIEKPGVMQASVATLGNALDHHRQLLVFPLLGEFPGSEQGQSLIKRF